MSSTTAHTTLLTSSSVPSSCGLDGSVSTLVPLLLPTYALSWPQLSPTWLPASEESHGVFWITVSNASGPLLGSAPASLLDLWPSLPVPVSFLPGLLSSTVLLVLQAPTMPLS